MNPYFKDKLRRTTWKGVDIFIMALWTLTGVMVTFIVMVLFGFAFMIWGAPTLTDIIKIIGD